MSRRGIRKGTAHARLVRRVLTMRAQSGDGLASNILGIARMFGVPIGLIYGRRDLFR